MDTIKPGSGLDFAKALQEEHDADRMGTVPVVQNGAIQSPGRRIGAVAPEKKIVPESEEDLDVGAVNPFVLPEETVILGLARVAEIKAQLAARKADRSS